MPSVYDSMIQGIAKRVESRLMHTPAWCSYLVVACLVFFVAIAFGCDLPAAGTSAAQEEATQLDGRIAQLPEISLSNIRFVFADKDRLYIELNNSTTTLWEEFVKQGPPKTVDEKALFSPLAEREREEYVFQQILEDRGDSYCVLFPDSMVCELRVLKHLAPYPSGDGGFLGFVGMLDRGSVGRSTEFVTRPIAIGFPSTKVRNIPGVADAWRTDVAVTSQITKYLQMQYLEKVKPKVLSYRYICIEGSKKEGLLARAQHGQREYLHVLRKHGDAYALVSFYQGLDTDASEGSTGVLLEDPQGETDTTPWQSIVYVLPDIDGNGSDELLIVSTESFLYSVEREKNNSHPSSCMVKLIREVYLGP